MKNSRALGLAGRKNDGEYYSGADISTGNAHADISINVTYPKSLLTMTFSEMNSNIADTNANSERSAKPRPDERS
jgi:hypothetical protein